MLASEESSELFTKGIVSRGHTSLTGSSPQGSSPQLQLWPPGPPISAPPANPTTMANTPVHVYPSRRPQSSRPQTLAHALLPSASIHQGGHPPSPNNSPAFSREREQIGGSTHCQPIQPRTLT
eukprot:scaffold116634_cov59-Attheya_sp.AAC.1